MPLEEIAQQIVAASGDVPSSCLLSAAGTVNRRPGWPGVLVEAGTPSPSCASWTSARLFLPPRIITL